MTKTSGDQLSAMYAQDDDDEKRPQPEQLRLAGKATLIPHQGGHLPVPRLDYVEILEQTVRAQGAQIENLTKRMRKLELQIGRASNIAERRINAVESQVKEIGTNRWDV